jgi:AraC-like DNA-binding protein
VAQEAGLSRRRFAQLFREQVGLTPKLYRLLRRFQDVSRQIALPRLLNWGAWPWPGDTAIRRIWLTNSDTFQASHPVPIDGLSSGFFEDITFREIVAADLASGRHRNPTSNPQYFTTAYFHRPEELAAEVREARFSEVGVLAVEGPAWSASQFREVWGNPVQRGKLMEFLSPIEKEPSILGASAHLIVAATSVD